MIKQFLSVAALLGLLTSCGVEKVPALQCGVGSQKIPAVFLKISDTGMATIRAIRQKAIRRKRLVRTSGDFVSAVFGADGKKYRAKVRLKGNFSDHWSDAKRWSFRVRLKDGKSWRNMREFSLQMPWTRQGLWDWVNYAFAKDQGLVVPVNGFALFRLNGEDLGAYMVEETLNAVWLDQHTQGKTVLLRFDDSRFWNFREKAKKAGQRPSSLRRSFYEMPFKVTLAKNATARADWKKASSAFESFRRQARRPSQVFDSKAVASFMAVADLFNGHHATQLTNLHCFSTSTQGGLLRPASYDPRSAAPDNEKFNFLMNLRLAHQVHGSAEMIAAEWLADPQIETEYRVVLKKLCKKGYLEAFFKQRSEILERAVKETKFYLSPAEMFKYLNARREILRTYLEKKLKKIHRLARPVDVNFALEKFSLDTLSLGVVNGGSAALTDLEIIDKGQLLYHGEAVVPAAVQNFKLNIKTKYKFMEDDEKSYSIVVLFNRGNTRYIKTIYPN